MAARADVDDSEPPPEADTNAPVAAPPVVEKGPASGVLSDRDRAAQMQVSAMAKGKSVPAPPPPVMDDRILAPVCGFAGLALAVPTAATCYGRRLQRQKVEKARSAKKPLPPPPPPADDEPAFASFFAELWAGPSTRPAKVVADEGATEIIAPVPSAEAMPVRVAILRYVLAGASQAGDTDTRQEILAELSWQLLSFKKSRVALQSLPLWQLAGVLERLARQLAGQPHSVTASSLRTLEGGIDMLAIAGAANPNPRLCTEPPVKLLVADSNPTLRHALEVALKAGFPEPDFAMGGGAGLARAAERAYDAIFLDDEMPGVNACEAGTKIRQTALNKTTSVVLVTRHSDFAGRAASAIAGGYELIGQPFTPLEVAVKALVAVVATRLELSRLAKNAAAPEPAGSDAGLLEDARCRAPVAG